MSLKLLRQEKGYSQEELASLTKLSTRTIQRIEKNKTASCESINILAKVFEIEVNEMEEYIKEPTLVQKDIELNNKKYKSFFQYLLTNRKTARFFIINIILIFINLLTNIDNLWFIYVLFIWGGIHFYKRLIEYKY